MVIPADATYVRHGCRVTDVDTSAYFDTSSAREAYLLPFSGAEKSQGVYSLRLIAAKTNSLNKIMTRTLHTPVDLTSRSFARLDIRAGRTGSNLAARVYQTYVLNGNLEKWSAGAYAAPDNWTLSGAGAAVERGGSAGDYHAVITRNGANANLYQNIHKAKEIEWWKGKEITLRAEVLATVANRARLAVADGAGTTYSSFHTGAGGWAAPAPGVQVCMVIWRAAASSAKTPAVPPSGWARTRTRIARHDAGMRRDALGVGAFVELFDWKANREGL